MPFVVVPLIFDLLFFIVGLFMPGLWKLAFAAVALIMAGVVLWQARPFLKQFQLTVTPKEVTVKDFRGNTVRKLDWKRVEAVAAGYKKNWMLYTYSFYFRVRGDEDLLFGAITREPGLTGKFQQFVKVFVRKKVPVQVVKAQ